MAEITYKGYIVKTQNEWFADERDRYLAIDQSWNLDASTPDGLKLATDAEIWSTLDEVGLRAYNSKDPSKATGYDLDALYYLTTGLKRSDGTPSKATLTLSGDDGAIIPVHSIIESTANGSQWSTLSTVTIANGSASVEAQCTTNGDTQASIGDITEIKTPTGGWQSATNAAPAITGTNRETDAELRIKRNKSVAISGSNQLDNMYAAIINVENVVDAVVLENFTDTALTNGLTPHSIGAIVYGGDKSDIALAMYSKKNPGTNMHAFNTAVTETVTSPITSNTMDITFSYADEVPITVDVIVENDGTLPANASELIKEAILDYVGGDLLSGGCGFSQIGFGIGDDVPISRMYTPINKVIGEYGNSYVSTLNLNTAQANIAIDFKSIATFADSRVSVVVQ